MNRLFGRGKPKEPPPNLTDCIANVIFGFYINFVMKMLLDVNVVAAILVVF